jgi:hypothetical protein
MSSPGTSPPSEVPFRVRLRGSGSVEIAAYGLADAEHRVEKELTAGWPEATVEIREVRRPASGRIVEEFTVAYLLRGEVTVEEDGREEARRRAFRDARARFAGTRYDRTAWEMEGAVEPG